MDDYIFNDIYCMNIILLQICTLLLLLISFKNIYLFKEGRHI